MKVESMKSPAQYADFVSEELILSYRNVVKSYYEKVFLSTLINAYISLKTLRYFSICTNRRHFGLTKSCASPRTHRTFIGMLSACIT